MKEKVKAGGNIDLDADYGGEARRLKVKVKARTNRLGYGLWGEARRNEGGILLEEKLGNIPGREKC